jgi:hypothetical protein
MMADDARDVVKKAGLDPRSWTPRELRHSFVSLLSEAGVPLEDLSRLVGHSSTVVTETVYRKELRPVLTRGAEAMDIVFRTEPVDRQSVTAVHGASGAYQPWGVARATATPGSKPVHEQGRCFVPFSSALSFYGPSCTRSALSGRP